MHTTASTILPLIAIPLLLSCGGGNPAPTPNPSPAATASQTPSPTPSPTPTAVAGSPTALLGGAAVGDSLSILIACWGQSEIRFDAQGRFTGYLPFQGDVFVPSPETVETVLRVTAVDRLQWDTNGFGGVTYGPANVEAGAAFVRYFVPDVGEMQIARNTNQLEFGTYGLLAEDNGTGPNDLLCFFAGGPVSTAAPSQRSGYTGFLDGYSVNSTSGSPDDWRLAGSTATLLFQGSGGNYRLHLDLKGVAEPFQPVEGQQLVDLPDFDIDLVARATDFTPVDTTKGGVRYRVWGRQGGPYGINAYLAFAITTADGSTYFGTIAMDGAQI